MSLMVIFVLVLPVLIMTLNVLQSGVGPTGEGLANRLTLSKIPYFFMKFFSLKWCNTGVVVALSVLVCSHCLPWACTRLGNKNVRRSF